MNIINKKFGKLTVIKDTGLRNNRKEILYECLCECGKMSNVKTYNLTKGHTKSCGCIKSGSKHKSIVGQKFNLLTAIKQSHIGKHRSSYYVFLCDCGNTTVCLQRNVTTSSTKSCGCHNKARDRSGKNNPNYNDDITDEERQRGRNIEGYKEWSFSIKEKYNFTCQICFIKKPGNLVSHHLYNYKDYPGKRVDINNGICLCKQCHLNFHNDYGRRHNTPEQIEEYKKEYITNVK